MSIFTSAYVPSVHIWVVHPFVQELPWDLASPFHRVTKTGRVWLLDQIASWTQSGQLGSSHRGKIQGPVAFLDPASGDVQVVKNSGPWRHWTVANAPRDLLLEWCSSTSMQKRKLNPPTSRFLTPKWLEDLEVTSWSVKKEDFYGALPFNSTGPVLSPGWSRLSYLPVLTMGIKQPPWTGDRTACVLSCPPRRPQRSAHRYWREDDSTNTSPGDRKTNWGKRNTAFTRA